MIRYSSYRGTNYRTNPSAPTDLPCSLAKEYRDLQDLRERVRVAEAAAAMRLKPRSIYSNGAIRADRKSLIPAGARRMKQE
jgi:hypothetical protein